MFRPEKIMVAGTEFYSDFKDRMRKVKQIEKKYVKPLISFENGIIAYQYEEQIVS